jgi:hypothetical protein
MTISTQQFLAVGVGTSANDGTGDDLRTAFQKVNANFGWMGNTGFNTANINVSGSIEATGNIVTTRYFVGDGSFLTNIAVSYSNVQVATYLPTYSGNIANLTIPGTLTTVGNVTAGAVNVTGAQVPVNGVFLSAANSIGFATNSVERWVINSSGSLVPLTNNTYDIGNGASNPRDVSVGRHLSVSGNVVIGNLYVPTSNTATGTAGQIVWDSGNIYVCIATDTWMRAALTSTF